MTKRVYLAGPVTHVEHSKWRSHVEDNSTWDCLNPLQRCDESWSDTTLVKKCYTDITMVDGVLAGDTGERSPGTWREVQFARERGVPVVVWDITSPREAFVEVLDVARTFSEAAEQLNEKMAVTNSETDDG